MTGARSFAQRYGPAFLLAAVLLCLPATARAQETPDDTTETRRVEIVAPSDSLVQTVREGAPVQKLIGNVRLRQGTTRLRADRATRFRKRDEILFTGDVFITDEGDSLWADRVRYDSRRKIGRARGRVRLSDGQLTLTGPRGRYFFREKHAVFPERPVLLDSARVLKSRSGEYFSKEHRAEFYGDVHSFSDSTYLEADSVTYLRDTEVSEARGHVFIERRGDRASGEEEKGNARTEERENGGKNGRTEERKQADEEEKPQTPNPKPQTAHADTLRRRPPPEPLPVDTVRAAPATSDTAARTLLFGRYAYNDPRAKYSRVVGNALLVRLQPPDSSETPAPAAPDSSEVPAVAPDSARTSEAPPPTAARPDTLILRAYQLETARSDTLRRLTATDSVRLWQRDLQAVGDSSVYDQFPPDESLPDSMQVQRREARLFGAPLAWSKEAQLNGDTIRVTGRDGAVRRLFARGHAFAVQQDTTLGRLQQLKGRRITGYFAQNDSTGETELRRLTSGPNAEAIFFPKRDGAPPDSNGSSSGDGGGGLQVSSDSIRFRVRGGEVRRIGSYSGIEGVRYSEENLPTPFQLDGMTWVPERRPQKEFFLEEERVRRSLPRPERPERKPPERPAPKPPPSKPPTEASPLTPASDADA